MMAGTSDWLDIRGWMESIVGWSMDQVHDLLPSSEIGLGPLGSVNLQGEFASIQGALETFIFTTIMCTIVVAIMITGAVSKTNLSAFVGTICSFVANFRKSAKAWKKPGNRNQIP